MKKTIEKVKKKVIEEVLFYGIIGTSIILSVSVLKIINLGPNKRTVIIASSFLVLLVILLFIKKKLKKYLHGTTASPSDPTKLK